MKNLKELLEHEIKDLYSAESQLVEAMPKMAKAASHPQLKKAIESHLQETKMQVQRLEEVAELLGISPKSREKCQGMKGLVEEGTRIMEEEDIEPEVLDAGLITAAQKIEHYEIAGYGSAHYFALMLGETEVAALLEQTLNEEKMTDEKLNAIAKGRVNELAMQS